MQHGTPAFSAAGMPVGWTSPHRFCHVCHHKSPQNNLLTIENIASVPPTDLLCPDSLVPFPIDLHGINILKTKRGWGILFSINFVQ